MSRADRDEERIDRLITRMWREGRPVKMIAQEAGLEHASTIVHRARRLGLERRTKPRRPGLTETGRPSKLTPAIASELAKLWPDETLSSSAIGQRLGTSGGTVWLWAKKLGLGPKVTRPSSANIARAQAAFVRRREERAAERLEQRQESPIPGIEPPCCFVCGGRSVSWDGHPQCRGRGRNAA